MGVLLVPLMDCTVSPENSYVGVLTPRTSEWDPIWTQVFTEVIKLK